MSKKIIFLEFIIIIIVIVAVVKCYEFWNKAEITVNYNDTDVSDTVHSNIKDVSEVGPTPTTSSISHKFSSAIFFIHVYHGEWTRELGSPEKATQRCIAWLNGNLPSGPPVPEGVKEAHAETNNICFTIVFVDGFEISIDPLSDEEKAIYIRE